jgi:hypothetical protein
MPVKRQDLRALHSLITEAKSIIDTSPELPQGRTQRAQELLGDALVLADFLTTQELAVTLGKKGGKTTARKMTAKEPDYYKRIAGMRKKRAGGRPKNPDAS